MNRSLDGLVIDTLEFAREGRSVSGVLNVAALPRLRELLVEDSGQLECELHGRREGRLNWLSLSVRGQLALRCQRCLGLMPYMLDVASDLQVIAPGEAWPDERLEDGALSLGADAIAAESGQSLAELIEEEVLLALPISPKHEEGCAPPARGDEKQAASPFAVLAQLKK